MILFSNVPVGSKNFVITDEESSPLFCERVLDREYNGLRKFRVFASRSDFTLLNATTQKLYLYFDANNPQPSTYVGGVSERPEVWNSDYKLVYHLLRDPLSTTIKESTSMGADLTIKGISEPMPQEGVDKYGSYIDFNGVSNWAESQAFDFSSLETQFTFEILHYLRSSGSYDRFMGVGTGNYVPGFFTGGVATKYNVGGWSVPYDSTTSITYDKLRSAVLRYNSNRYNLFVNAVKDSVEISSSNTADLSNSTFWLGNDPTNAGNGTYVIDGYLGSVRVSSIPRSDNWLTTSFHNDLNRLTVPSALEAAEHHFSGQVLVRGVPYDGLDVALFKREDSSIVSSTTTVSGGLYDVYSTYAGEHYLVVFPPSGTNLNAQIFGNLITTFSG